MRWQSVPIVSSFGADDAKPWACPYAVNWIPTNAEGPAISQAMLRTPPGLYHLATLGDRWRGLRDVEGQLYGVSGNGLYRILADQSVLRCGDIPGSGLVSMTHNQIANGNEVVIGTGSSGYVWNTVTEELTRITDSGFPGFLVCDFIAQLIVGIEPQRRYFFNSALADALSYNALETYESEAAPDRLRSLIVDHRELWLFNERTIEIFDYLGETNALFRNKGIVIEQGCAATHSVRKLDNAVFWLGNHGVVYRSDDYNARRISNKQLEQQFARCDLSKAFAFTWEDRGHAVYYLTFPDGLTWGYDCSTNQWHRRASGQDIDNNRWRLSCLTKWRGEWYGGEYNSGRLFKLVWDYVQEGDDDLISEWLPPALYDAQNRATVHALELVFDTGQENVTPVVDDLWDALDITGDLPPGDTGDIVSYTYEATGGITPYVFSLASGALPTGLSLSSAGVVTGTMTASGTFNWVVRVTDAEGNVDTVADSCVVTGELFITGDLPSGYVGEAVSYQYIHGEGTAPRVVDISAGALPDGLSVDADGLVTGTPTTADDFTWTVRVTDDDTQTDTVDDSASFWETGLVFLGRGNTDDFKSYTFAGGNLVEADAFTLDDESVKGMARPPQSNRLYICSPLTDEVRCINVLDGSTVGTIAVGNQPRDIAAGLDYAYAVNYTHRTVSKIRLSDNTVVGTSDPFSVGYSPTHCCLNSDYSELWVAATSGVVRVNADDLSITNELTLATVWGIAIAPDDSKVYVGRSLASNFRVIDPSDNSSITVGLDGTPRGICFWPDGTKCVIGITEASSGVQLVDVATNTPSAVVSPFSGNYPTSVFTDHARTYIFVQAGSTLYLLDPDDMSVVVDSLACTMTSGYAAGRVLP